MGTVVLRNTADPFQRIPLGDVELANIAADPDNPDTYVPLPIAQPSTNEVIKEAFKEFFATTKGEKDFAKLIKAIINIAEVSGVQLPDGWRQAARVAGNAKDLIGALEIYDKVFAAVNAYREFDTSTPARTALSVATVTVKTADIYQAGYDMTVLVNDRIASVPREVMTGLSAANSSILAAVSIYEIGMNGAKMEPSCRAIAASSLAEETTQKGVDREMEKVGSALKKIGLHMINIAKFVSYLALAAICLVSLIWGIVFPPALFIAFSTSALVFSIFGFFYDKIVDPSGKRTLEIKVKPTMIPAGT